MRDFFERRDGELYCEGLSLDMLAEKEGTPLYVYSASSFRERYRALDRAFSEIDHMICYSVKVNSNLAVIDLLRREGSGFDIVSGGELFRVIKAGGDPGRIVFAGVGKSEEEITAALEQDIYMFNVESLPEAERINVLAGRLGKTARIAVRINPDVEAKTHKYITTGTKENKFGLPIDFAREIFSFVGGLESVRLVGIHSHIGSQLTSVEPYVRAVNRVVDLIRNLREAGFAVETLNIGGGLGIVYRDETPPSPEELSKAIVPLVRDTGVRLLLEPGRFIAGNSGVLLARVEYFKDNVTMAPLETNIEIGGAKRFLIVDAAMNDLIRPAFYQAYHHIEPVKERTGREKMKVDIVGPICESGDFLAKERELPGVEPGDLLAVRSAGAYGFVMSGNYNSRPRAAEVLVNGDEYRVVRKRETFERLVEGECLWPG